MDLTWLLDHALPLNRKERFYTATVLPGIVCADFAELSRLTGLLGHGEVDVSGDPDFGDLVFFTEYGIAESVYGASKERFTGLPTGRDTPDVVFLTLEPSPVLFALEAKMYDRPGGGALRSQLDVQANLLEPLADRLAEWLGVDEVPLVHAALLPPAQMDLHLDPYPMISWAQVREAFADVAPAYWLRMLDEAIARYDDLVTKSVANDAAKLTGREIVDSHLAGTLPFAAMGRAQGFTGALLEADLDSGAWMEQRYQVAYEHPGNSNWFHVADFVSLAHVEAPPEDERLDPIDDLREALICAQTIGERVFGEGSVSSALTACGDEALMRMPGVELRRVAALYRAATQAMHLARAESDELFTAAKNG